MIRYRLTLERAPEGAMPRDEDRMFADVWFDERRAPIEWLEHELVARIHQMVRPPAADLWGPRTAGEMGRTPLTAAAIRDIANRLETHEAQRRFLDETIEATLRQGHQVQFGTDLLADARHFWEKPESRTHAGWR